MTVPKYYELFNPVLGAIKRLGGSASIQELNEEVLKELQLSPQEASTPHGDRGTEVAYRLAWARSYLKAYGVLAISGRGVWSLTGEGAEADSVDPEAVVRRVRELYYERRSTRGETKGEVPTEELEADLEMSWREQLQTILLNLSPDKFERLCQRLLRESGFVQVRVTGKSGDGGIDGVGVVRIGGLLGFSVLFQC